MLCFLCFLLLGCLEGVLAGKIVITREMYASSEGVCSIERGLEPLVYQGSDHASKVLDLFYQEGVETAWIGSLQNEPVRVEEAVPFLQQRTQSTIYQDGRESFTATLKVMFYAPTIQNPCYKRVLCVVTDELLFQEHASLFNQ